LAKKFSVVGLDLAEGMLRFARNQMRYISFILCLPNCPALPAAGYGAI